MPKKGYVQTEEHKEKLSISLKGKVLSEKTKQKISLARTGKSFPHKGVPRSKETREKIRQATIKQLKEGRMPNKETKIERLFKKTLITYNIKFEEQKTFKLGIADFYLPEYNAFIFCDGNYWHNYPNGKPRDSKQVEYLESEGFKAYRFWEHDILNNCNKIVGELK